MFLEGLASGPVAAPRLPRGGFPQGVGQALSFSKQTWYLCQALPTAFMSNYSAGMLLMFLTRDKNILLIHLFVALRS